MVTMEALVTKKIAADVKLGEGVKIYDFVNLGAARRFHWFQRDAIMRHYRG